MTAGTAGPDDLEVLAALGEAPLTVEGRILVSSNAALLVTLRVGTFDRHAIYKPISRERPLWDYPDGTLAGRERAAYVVSRLGGWDVVPPTALRGDGPLGPGSVQLWVEGESRSVVDILAPGNVPDGWRAVVEGTDGQGRAVVLAHATDPGTRRIAVLDLVLNTSDRKGSHLIRDVGSPDRVWGVDHGVSLGVDPKVRTVLWGFVGETFTAADLAPLNALRSALSGAESDELALHLTPDEVAALASRVELLLESGCFPGPNEAWPAVPWPAL